MRNGEAGLRGGPPGDLYVVVHIKEHEVFEREENNLFCEVPVSFSTAALGGEVNVPTLDGQAQLKIPAGTQGGTPFKLRGKGVPSLNSHSRGDLIVRVAVEVPTRLNAEQRKKLEEFSALMGEENSPLHKGFFEKAKEFFG
jgi:molecular chaperone DnaJ